MSTPTLATVKDASDDDECVIVNVTVADPLTASKLTDVPAHAVKAASDDDDDDCVIVNVTDLNNKHELEKLGLAKPSPVRAAPAASSPAQKVQRSIRDWFCATGKENAIITSTLQVKLERLSPGFKFQLAPKAAVSQTGQRAKRTQNVKERAGAVSSQSISQPKNSKSVVACAGQSAQKKDALHTPNKQWRMPVRTQSERQPRSHGAGRASSFTTFTTVKDAGKKCELFQTAGKKRLVFDESQKAAPEKSARLETAGKEVRLSKNKTAVAGKLTTPVKKVQASQLMVNKATTDEDVCLKDKPANGLIGPTLTVKPSTSGAPSSSQISRQRVTTTQSLLVNQKTVETTTVRSGQKSVEASTARSGQKSVETSTARSGQKSVETSTARSGQKSVEATTARSSGRRRTVTDRMNNFQETEKNRKRKNGSDSDTATSSEYEPDDVEVPEEPFAPPPPPPPALKRTARGLASRMAESESVDAGSGAEDIEKRVGERMKIAMEKIRNKSAGADHSSDASASVCANASSSCVDGGGGGVAATVSSPVTPIIVKLANTPAAQFLQMGPLTSTPRKRKLDGVLSHGPSSSESVSLCYPTIQHDLGWPMAMSFLPASSASSLCGLKSVGQAAAAHDLETASECKTIPDCLSMIMIGGVEERDFQVAVNTAQFVSTSVPSVEAVRSMLIVVKVGSI
jgi:hypothetical protein